MLTYLFYKMIDWLSSTKAWEWFFKTLNTYNIRFKGYPEFRISDYFKIIDSLKPDRHYVFLSTDSKSLSSIVIKATVKNGEGEGYFSHAGIVIFKGERYTTILHVRDTGFIEQPLIDFLKMIDYLCIIELPIDEKDESLISLRIQALKTKAESVTYDWEQKLNNGELKLYCSELIYNIFKDTVNDPEFKPRKLLGRWVFDPDRILDCGKIIYCNHPKIKN